MKNLTRAQIISVFGELAINNAEKAQWAGDIYTHPQHGECRAVLYKTLCGHLVTLYKGKRRTPVGYGIISNGFAHKFF